MIIDDVTIPAAMNHLTRFARNVSAKLSVCVGLSLGLSLGMGLGAQSASAAENWTFIIGPINRSVTLTQLRHLAETGKPTGDLKLILKLAGQDPAKVAEVLNDEVQFDLVTAYRILSSAPGEAILAQLGEVIAPRNANSSGAQALSGALLLSLSGDNKFTVLELLEKYPTDARINVEALMQASEQFGDLSELLGTLAGGSQ
jgi:hypothetical protein